jgi:hypothetical protein
MNIKPLTPAGAQNSVTSVNAGGHKQSQEPNKDSKKRRLKLVTQGEEADQKENIAETTEISQQLISSESVIQLLDKKPTLPNQKLEPSKKPLPQNIKGLNRVL